MGLCFIMISRIYPQMGSTSDPTSDLRHTQRETRNMLRRGSCVVCGAGTWACGAGAGTWASISAYRAPRQQNGIGFIPKGHVTHKRQPENYMTVDGLEAWSRRIRHGPWAKKPGNDRLFQSNRFYHRMTQKGVYDGQTSPTPSSHTCA